MTRWTYSLAAIALFGLAGNLAAADWQQFRGTDHTGVATDASLPIEISADKNLAWKLETPGGNASSPIVVDGRVIVTASSGVRQDRLHVIAADAETGKQLWHRQFWATGRTLCHPFSSVAAPSPASDGERIYAFFSSNDLICLDLDGNLLWYRGLTYDYPTAANDVGMSSSPCVVGDTVVVQMENEANSFAAGIDAKTGAERWRSDRPKIMNWTSPTAMPGPKGIVLLQSSTYLTANSARTGKQLWRFEQDASTMASPLAIGETVFVPTKNGVASIEQVGSTDEVNVRWTQSKLNPSASSPLVNGGRVYTLNRAGILACANQADGEVLWQQRLKGPYWATPIIAGEHLYAFNSDGGVQTIKLGDQSGEIVASGELGDAIKGTPAVADNALYIRSDKAIWKFSK